MTFTYGFYNSVSGDRMYDARQMSDLVKGIISDGIFSMLGTAMRVTNGGGLIANVGIGKAWFNGTWSDNDAVLPITLDTADALLPRIDAIVLEVDTNTGVRANTIKFVKGTPATVPVNPTLITGALKNQYALAYCRINAGSTTITSITDNVGTVSTPLITTGLEPSLPKASAAEVTAGTIDTKYVTPKGIKDSVNVPNAAPGAAGNLMRSNGTNWVSQQDDGWIQDSNTWTYSSQDGPTGIISINADMTTELMAGMRLKYTQTRNVSCYCPMDANSNSSIGTFTMTDTGITYTAGKIGNAATFNGTSSKIVVADSAFLKPTSSFTISLWLKATTNVGGNQSIFSSYSQNTNVAGIFMLLHSSGKLNVGIGKNTGVTTGVDFTTLFSRTTIGDTVWHHIVVTFRNNYLQIYVDGQLDAYAYCVSPAYAATNYIRLGARNLTGTDTDFLNGQIDDFFVLTEYAIDEENIRARYLASTAQGTTITLTKKSIVTNVGPYFGGNTLITSFYGMDFEISNNTITNPCYSGQKVPFGFNANPDKWKVLSLVQTSQAKNSGITLGPFNGGSQLTPAGISLVVPIGMWNVEARAAFSFTCSTANATHAGKITLSTSETLEVFPEYTSYYMIYNVVTSIQYVFPYSLAVRNIMCPVKTTFTLNLSATFGTITSLSILNSPYASIVFTCAYL